MNFVVKRPSGKIVTPTKSRDQRQLLGFGVICGSNYRAQTGSIGSHGLLAKYMFSSVDCSSQVHGPETRRSCENDEVNATFQHLFVGVKSCKLVLGCYLDFFFSRLFEGIMTDIQTIRIHVPHGSQHDVGIRLHCLAGRTSPTPTTANQSYSDSLIIGSECLLRD